MTMKNERIFVFCFQALCLCATFALCIYWCYKFGLDEDISVVQYDKFYQTSDDVHPTISLCLKNPFLKHRLHEYGTNETSYISFLRGEIFSKELMGINYSNVTVNIFDFIKSYTLSFKSNATFIETSGPFSLEQKKRLIFNNFNGFNPWNEFFYKCFEFIVPPYGDIDLFEIKFSNRIYGNGKRTEIQLRSEIHLPKNFLLPGLATRWSWPVKAKFSRYTDRAVILSIDIVHNRNKKLQECNERWKDYDNWVINKHIMETGCHSPYQKARSHHEVCGNQELMTKFKLYQDIITRKNYITPCKAMQIANINWNEHTREDAKNGEFGDFGLGIYFPTSIFKKTIQTRALSINSLVGNIGGYVGLFMGVSVSQLPNLLLRVCAHMKGFIQQQYRN